MNRLPGFFHRVLLVALTLCGGFAGCANQAAPEDFDTSLLDPDAIYVHDFHAVPPTDPGWGPVARQEMIRQLRAEGFAVADRAVTAGRSVSGEIALIQIRALAPAVRLTGRYHLAGPAGVSETSVVLNHSQVLGTPDADRQAVMGELIARQVGQFVEMIER